MAALIRWGVPSLAEEGKRVHDPQPYDPRSPGTSCHRRVHDPWHKLTPRTRESVVGGMVGLALFVGWNVYSYQHDISTATGDNLA